MRPVVNAPADEPKPWSTKQRVGINPLKEIIPTIARASGVRYTNHSLRATAVTRMLNKGVPEKIISQKSGHRSTKALRAYEHVSAELQKAAGRVIAEESEEFVVKQESGQKPGGSAKTHHFSGQLYNCTINITYQQ